MEPTSSLVRLAVHVRFQGGVKQVTDRSRDAVPAPEFDHLAGKPRQFEPVAAQEIVAHRGHAVGRHRAELHDHLVDSVGRQGDPLGEADRGRLAQARFA